jgi:large exoprotein involved in heme utilization and adhesion
VAARDVIGAEGGQISASTLGAGDGGVVEVEASDQIVFAGGRDHNGETIVSGIFSTAERGSTGRGGQISVRGDRLLLDDRGQISASTAGTGDGGGVVIDANQLTVQGRAVISANTTRRQEGGTGGTIRVTADAIDVQRNGQISTSSRGSGDAGGIVVDEVDRLRLRSGGAIEATTRQTENGGLGGIINISANQLQVFDERSRISTSSDGDGNGGRIFIEADEVEVFDGGQILTSTNGAGNAGDLELQVIELIDVAGRGSGLLANTGRGSTGDGGNIVIDPELVVVRDRAVIGASSAGTGRGGNVSLTADRLELRNGGQILADNDGLVPGGNITLNTGQLFIEDASTISASTAIVDGGNVVINSNDIVVMRNGSNIEASAGDDGNGGNIRINTNLLFAVLSENSDIRANAVLGQGGSVNITAPLGIYGIQLRDEPTPLSDITVSSTFGSSGTVILNTPDVDPNRGTSELPSDFVNPGFNQVCQASGSAGSSRFVDTGRGGVPPSEEATLSSFGEIWDDGRSLDDAVQGITAVPFLSQSAALASREAELTFSSDVVEAQGWMIRSGEIVLAPQASDVVPYSSLQVPIACDGMTTMGPSHERSPDPSAEPVSDADNAGEGWE